VEAHCFPESTNLHCDKQTGRCLCNLPKIWNNVDKTCSDPTDLPQETLSHQSHPRRFRREVAAPDARPKNQTTTKPASTTKSTSNNNNGDWENFEKWEPLVAIGLFMFIMGLIVFILKCWITRSSDVDSDMQTKAAKSLKVGID
jgi:hypothetical protein